MISLIITLFICLFSVCPTNYQVVDHIENNVPLVKNTITYEDHTGYLTNTFEICNWEAWESANIVFGNVWSDFDEGIYSSGSFDRSYTSNTLTSSGLYLGFHPYYDYEDVYSMTLSWLNENYSGYEVVRYKLYNTVYSLWNSSPSINAYEYYWKIMEFYLRNGSTFYLYFYKGQDNSYSVRFNYWDNVNDHYNDIDYCGMFFTDECSFKPLFKITPIYESQAQADEYYRDGYNNGYQTGLEIGDGSGYTRGYNEGQQQGYQEGLAHADYDSTALTIMQGIIDVGLLPVNVFLMILNFEVFGVNVSGFVSALLTISIVIIIVRFLFGGKSNDK